MYQGTPSFSMEFVNYQYDARTSFLYSETSIRVFSRYNLLDLQTLNGTNKLAVLLLATELLSNTEATPSRIEGTVLTIEASVFSIVITT